MDLTESSLGVGKMLDNHICRCYRERGVGKRELLGGCGKFQSERPVRALVAAVNANRRVTPRD